jgi:N-methylhydantoinase B
MNIRVRNLAEGSWIFQQSSRDKCPPWGLQGGAPGATGDYLLKEPADPDYRKMTVQAQAVAADSIMVIRTGGGGGWGDPLERDPALVAADVAEALIAPQTAERDYGVVLGADRTVDPAATASLRAQRRSLAPNA